MPKLSLVVTCLAGILVGIVGSCGDEPEDSGPVACYEAVDDCADCPAGLMPGMLSGGGCECYVACDTASDCADCELETVCGYGEGNRQLCVQPQG